MPHEEMHERVCDDVQHAPLAHRERDLVPLVPREEGREDVRCRRLLDRHVRTWLVIVAAGDGRGGGELRIVLVVG